MFLQKENSVCSEIEMCGLAYSKCHLGYYYRSETAVSRCSYFQSYVSKTSGSHLAGEFIKKIRLRNISPDVARTNRQKRMAPN